MPTQSYSVSQAAHAADISASTVRSWCTTFAANLSPGASPGPGIERTLTPADIATMQRIKELRSTGATYDQITTALDDLDPMALQPYIDIAPAAPAQAPKEAIQDSQQGLQLALGLLQAIDDRTSPLQARVDAIEQGQSSRFTWFVWGFLCGALVVLVAILALSLGVSR